MKRRISNIKKSLKETDEVISLLGFLSSSGVVLIVLGLIKIINDFLFQINSYETLLFGLPLYYLLSIWLYFDTVKDFTNASFKKGFIFGVIIVVLIAAFRIIFGWY